MKLVFLWRYLQALNKIYKIYGKWTTAFETQTTTFASIEVPKFSKIQR